MLNNEKGFTLLEIVLALAIFSAGIIAVMRAFSAGIVSSGDRDNIALALDVARKKLEELQNIPFAGIIDSGPVPADTTVPYSRFNVTVGTAGINPKQINVTVDWSVKGGTTGITIATLRTNY